MKFAYSREIPNDGCEVLLKTRSEVEPYTNDKRGTNLHLVMTTGHQDLCPVGVYRYDFRSSWRSWTSIIPGCEPYSFAAKEFMSDVLRLLCEWIAKNRNIVVELNSKTEGDQRYINIDLRGFQDIRDPEKLIKFIIIRMVHKAKIILEYYRMQNNLE